MDYKHFWNTVATAMTWETQQTLYCSICKNRIVDVPGEDGGVPGEDDEVTEKYVERFEFVICGTDFCCKSCVGGHPYDRHKYKGLYIVSKNNNNQIYESDNNCECPECVWCFKHKTRYDWDKNCDCE
jgi:hypothetical protein